MCACVFAYVGNDEDSDFVLQLFQYPRSWLSVSIFLYWMNWGRKEKILTQPGLS